MFSWGKKLLSEEAKKSNYELEKGKGGQVLGHGFGDRREKTHSESGLWGRSTCWRGSFRWFRFGTLVTVMVIALVVVVVVIVFAWMTISGSGTGGGIVVVFMPAVQPRAGKSGNLTGSSVLVRVVVSDVGAPLLPSLGFWGRLPLAISGV